MGIEINAKRDVVVNQNGKIITEVGNGVSVNSIEGNLRLRMTGDIETHGMGIKAIAHQGAVDLIRRGDINAQGYGVHVSSAVGGVNIQQTGQITSTGKRSAGIIAVSSRKDVDIFQKGTINVEAENSSGVNATSAEGNINIRQEGDVFVSSKFGYGFYANSAKGSVDISQTGNITAEKEGSHGIFAVSSENDVNVNHQNGHIYVKGRNSKAIVLASRKNLRLSLTDSYIKSVDDIGIVFDGGKSNILEMNGNVEISGGLRDIIGGSGNEMIINNGVFTSSGSIDLREGVNTFQRQAWSSIQFWKTGCSW